MDEQEQIARSQAGELESFNRLVERYQGQVFNLAVRMLGSVASAEDVAQETFLAAFRHIKTFRGGSFKAWLLRIATNASYDQLRSAQRRRTLSLEGVVEEDPTWEPSSRLESPEEHALRAELAQEISEALQALAPEQRAVLILADIEGLAYEEIAQAARISLGTVKSRLSRARAHLRASLGQQGELLAARRRLE